MRHAASWLFAGILALAVGSAGAQASEGVVDPPEKVEEEGFDDAQEDFDDVSEEERDDADEGADDSDEGMDDAQEGAEGGG